MTFGKLKLLTAVVLVFGLISGSLGLQMQGAPTLASPTTQATPEKKPDEPAKDKEKQAVEVNGSVLGPDGKPVAGAKIFVLGQKRTKPEAITTADKDGKFTFSVKPEEIGNEGRVLAAAEGHAPDWLDFAQCQKGAVTLRLHTDDIPFTGRVVTLEGQPVVGATVEVQQLGKPADGDELKPWIDDNVKQQNLAKQRKEKYWVNQYGLLQVTPSAFGYRLMATTDKDGKFRLTGAGRDRVLSVKVRGEGVEYKYFWVVTHADAPKDGYIKTGDVNCGLYGPEMTILVGPSRPIIGTVRDRATGQPIAGLTILEQTSYIPRAVTDAEGRYRLEGVPKTEQYLLSVISSNGPKRLPYFDQCVEVKDTAGFKPLTKDFKLDRSSSTSS